MFAPSTRQPLLHAQRRRAVARHRQPPSRKSNNSSPLVQQLTSFSWLLFPAIIIFSMLASYFLLPSINKHKKQFTAPLDSEHELYQLHHDPSHDFCSLNRLPLTCAHGGDLETAPPNTIEAFRAAIEQHGAECIEVDVSMTKDGHLIALHDRDMASILGQSSANQNRKNLSFYRRKKAEHAPRIGDYTWEQLKKLEWYPNGPKIATFLQILNLALNADHLVKITVDVKLREAVEEREEAEMMAQAVHDTLNEANCGQQCLIWGKSDHIAAVFKLLNRQQRVGLVVQNETLSARESGRDNPLRLKSLGAEVISIHYEMANSQLSRQLREIQKEVHVWTANTAAMMKAALDAGPDAVVTSYPRKLMEALKNRGAACKRRLRRDS